MNQVLSTICQAAFSKARLSGICPPRPKCDQGTSPSLILDNGLPAQNQRAQRMPQRQTCSGEHSRTPRQWLPWLSFSLTLSLLQPLPAGRAAPTAWETKEGYRVALLDGFQGDRAGFTLLPPEKTGILFTNQLSYAKANQNHNLLNGAGVAAGDFDGDGWCDLYFCNLEGEDALYRNRGDWTFENVTAASGLGLRSQISRAAVFADLNGDNHLDLLVSSISGPNAFLLNDGQGKFTDVTRQAGMVLKAGGHSYALADIDGDADLDVYLANYGEESVLRGGGTLAFRYIGGKPVVSGRYARRLKIVDGELIELGEPDVLYENQGDGTFQSIPWNRGRFLDENGRPLRTAPYDMGLSAAFRDLNQDGYPDLYVCNDFQTPDRIWINDGQGTFRAIAQNAIRSTPHFSMGVDFADINRDGLDDFFISDMLSPQHQLRMTQINVPIPPDNHVDQFIDREQFRRNGLYLNRGDGTYAEIAQLAGLAASDWSWSVVFLDVDLDGYEDLLIANGHAYDTQDLDVIEKTPDELLPSKTMGRAKNLSDYPALRTPNLLFLNQGDLTFAEAGTTLGFHSTQVTHGISLVDLDNDGDQDVVASCLWDPPLIYRNDSTAPRIAVRLRGLPPNVQGIGARIHVTGGPVPQSQEIISGGRYLAADDPMRVFATGTATNPCAIEVLWRSGKRSVIANAMPNRIYEIHESHAQPHSRTQPPQPAPQAAHFVNVSSQLGHSHQDRPFADFDLQPLLPFHLDQFGPGLAWYDWDEDGDDDLLIGSGNAGLATAWLNDGQGHFSRLTSGPWTSLIKGGDLTGVVGWTPNPQQPEALFAQSHLESPGDTSARLRRFGLAKDSPPTPTDLTLQGPSSAGPVSLADVDGDGDLDVFVGGQFVPGRYPQAADSTLYLNEGGQLNPDAKNRAVLQNLGLVQGAVFSDLNQDGWPDLILACAWSPIRILINQKGAFAESTSDWNMEKYVGLWHGITTGDFNRDGRMDIVAGNWGWNSYLGKPSPETSQFPSLVYGDFDQNGSVEIIEALPAPGFSHPVPRRQLDFLSAAMPLLRVRFPTHKAFSKIDVPTMLENRVSQSNRIVLNHLATTLFLNQGDSFTPSPLPVEAQLAPVFGVAVADFDGDSHEDVFLCHNFFGHRKIDSRLDSGRGLWLRGRGQGQWTVVPGHLSGIRMYGAQRAAAVADFNQDGRPDLAVTQNAGTTELWQNQSGQPGLRVRLQGGRGNPHGIGAQLRFPNGPTRELHAGSGFWSQDSALTVLARPASNPPLHVRWPGGAEVTYQIPANAMQVTLSPTGNVKVAR